MSCFFARAPAVLDVDRCPFLSFLLLPTHSLLFFADRCNENELGSFTFAEVLAGLGLRQCGLGHLLGALRKQVALFGL